MTGFDAGLAQERAFFGGPVDRKRGGWMLETNKVLNIVGSSGYTRRSLPADVITKKTKSLRRKGELCSSSWRQNLK